MRRNFIRVLPSLHQDVFVEAFCSRDIAVQFADLLGACPLMEPVDILSDEKKLWNVPFHGREGQMGRIGMDFGNFCPAHRVPFPHQFRITPEGIRSRQILGPEFGPMAGLSIAERWDTGFGADPRSGEDGEPAGLTQVIEQ